MKNRLALSLLAFGSFFAAAGLSAHLRPDAASEAHDPTRASLHVPFDVTVSYPAAAYASGTCSLAPTVCANDSSPGCAIICGGGEQATCVEGSCTAAGNVAAPNRCTCK